MIVLVFLVFSPINSLAQLNPDLSDSNKVNKARLKGVIITESALFAASMTGLYALWYKDYPMNGFHLINDNGEWQQMDKMGHATTSYYFGKIGYEALKWSGVKENKAIWYGGLYGSAYLLTIEILDGFSAEWGFSLGDFSANTFGSALFISQQLAWHEQRVMLKYSSHTTDYAQYRPDLLGSNLPQRIIKDYNGCTFWLSGNIYSFLPKSSGFPKWLNVAIGYGAEGMIGGHSNPLVYKGNTMPSFDRYRQFYLSLDIDLTRISTKSKTLDLIFDLIGFIKIPLPTLEYNTKDGFKGHGLYF
ncbi:MAG: DUF2279 domain-containing protein [Bacteroidetes bacterium]|nr:DUF2279 domain-containing protein [Bacteroidota bacterium]